MAHTGYEKLTPYPPIRPAKNHRLALAAASIFLIITTILLLVFKTQQHTSQPQLETQSPCGNSSAQARQNGCGFDFVTYAWLPAECVDSESNDEYRKWMYGKDRIRGPFPVFRDQEGKERIEDEEELSERAGKGVFLTRESHWAHCLLMFRKLPRARNKGTTVDRTAASMRHMKHCTNIIVNIDEADPDPTLDSLDHLDPVHVGFGFCIGYDSPWL